MSDDPSFRNRRFTMADNVGSAWTRCHPCSDRRPCSQACIRHCTIQRNCSLLSTPYAYLRYSLEDYRPSETNNTALSTETCVSTLTVQRGFSSSSVACRFQHTPHLPRSLHKTASRAPCDDSVKVYRVFSSRLQSTASSRPLQLHRGICRDSVRIVTTSIQTIISGQGISIP
jgi:hypothetical protein